MKTKHKIGFMTYLKKEKLKLTLFISLNVLNYILDFVATILVAEFIAQITAANYSQAIITLSISFGAMIIGRLSGWASNIFLFRIMSTLSTNIKLDLSKRMFQIKSKAFNSSSAGLFVSRITSDPENAFWALSDLMDDISNIFSAALTLIYIMVINVWIGIFMAAILLFLGLYERIRIKKYIKNDKKLKKSNENVISLANEIVRSEKDIKSLNLEKNLEKTAESNYNVYKKDFYKKEMVDSHFWNSRNLAVIIFSFGLSMLGLFLMKNLTLSLSSFLFIFMNRDSLNYVTWSMGDILRRSADCKIASERMFEIFDDNKFPIETFGSKTIENFNGNIEFKNVGFSYEEPVLDEETGKVKEVTLNKVFENLSFKIKENQTVAFVGKSGSGKSTILSLVSKLFECDEGEVLLDGININELSKETLRSNISLVNQFPYIFDASIKNNLLMANENATDKDIIDACKKASLWEFIETLKNGLNTKVGENGVKLSGGQKQRLAIARALLKNSKVIIFDESTSSLDNFAQNDIKKSLDNLQGGKTIIIVAHRLSTIKNADKIYFLSGGEIVDSGKFKELFNRNQSFKEMFLAEAEEN